MSSAAGGRLLAGRQSSRVVPFGDSVRMLVALLVIAAALSAWNVASLTRPVGWYGLVWAVAAVVFFGLMVPWSHATPRLTDLWLGPVVRGAFAAVSQLSLGFGVGLRGWLQELVSGRVDVPMEVQIPAASVTFGICLGLVYAFGAPVSHQRLTVAAL